VALRRPALAPRRVSGCIGCIRLHVGRTSSQHGAVVLRQLAIAARAPLRRQAACRRRVLPVQLQQLLSLADQEVYILGRLLEDCSLPPQK